MSGNRAAFLELEATDRLSADELWEATGFARCDDCAYLMRTQTLTALPEHRCTQRQATRRTTAPEEPQP